ncbi:HugZ family pyridoxamine 5'-phosphate oxidase [Flavimaricola marinus]|uniref:Pyridoxamine 5'-phosphate oxidase n=1 Tax=Flavimaricola marinus TaxID=1819565 RepID=A0A238LA21_9RHOB|nr:pyridoxamine 5'-phosphate oxidase family protein [Flavimaricola marinus]SMY06529.1 Pyridoxamine 5'-phosphate oxidase [Flavimaricola marinus]
MTDPIRPTDDDARALARQLLTSARFGALATHDPETGLPHVARVAVGHDGGDALLLISELSLHTRHLGASPGAALLLGEPGDKGDPLTHPRMTIQGRCEEADKARLRDAWLSDHPKTALYYDFADFRLLRLVGEAVHLNGGFGKAYLLAPADLAARNGS